VNIGCNDAVGIVGRMGRSGLGEATEVRHIALYRPVPFAALQRSLTITAYFQRLFPAPPSAANTQRSSPAAQRAIRRVEIRSYFEPGLRGGSARRVECGMVLKSSSRVRRQPQLELGFHRMRSPAWDDDDRLLPGRLAEAGRGRGTG
jgi:hypothetical protein